MTQRIERKWHRLKSVMPTNRTQTEVSATSIRWWLGVLLLALVIAPVPQLFQQTSFAQTTAAAKDQHWQTVAPGVEHQQLIRGQKSDTEATGPWLINLLRVDLTKARLRMVHAMDEGVGVETVSSLAARYDAIAAVNSGYFRTTGTYRGESVGVTVFGGKLTSEPHNKRVAMGLIESPGATDVVFGHLSFSAFLKGARSGPGFMYAIDGFNRPRGTNELIIFTPEFHRTTLTSSAGLELIVRQGRVMEVRDQKGSSAIPADGFVISAAGTARKWAREKLTINSRVTVTSNLEPLQKDLEALWKKAKNIVGGGPQLIKGGRVEITTPAERMTAGFDTTRHPRTAVGKLAGGRILFVTVDGRQPGVSVGMSLGELAALLLEFGAQDGINLDGGGSTTMVIRNKIVNKPSDTSGERPISDAILILPR